MVPNTWKLQLERELVTSLLTLLQCLINSATGKTHPMFTACVFFLSFPLSWFYSAFAYQSNMKTLHFHADHDQDFSNQVIQGFFWLVQSSQYSFFKALTYPQSEFNSVVHSTKVNSSTAVSVSFTRRFDTRANRLHFIMNYELPPDLKFPQIYRNVIFSAFIHFYRNGILEKQPCWTFRIYFLWLITHTPLC